MTLAEGPVADGAPTPTAQRTCPRCGAALAREQEWCLNCGAAATTRIAAAPTWRGPLAAMLGVGLLALAALALAFFALADDDPPPPVAATPTPAPTATAAAPTPTPTAGDGAAAAGGATPTPASTPSPTATPAGTGEPASWPAGRSAWTIVMFSSTSRAAAVRRAQRLAAEGVVVGLLETDRFRSLPAGRFFVFSGQYESSREATQAQRALGSAAPANAFVRRIVPR